MVKGAHLNPINLTAQPLDGITSSAAASKRKGTELNVSNLDAGIAGGGAAAAVAAAVGGSSLPFRNHSDDLDFARQHDLAASLQLSAKLREAQQQQQLQDVGGRDSAAGAGPGAGAGSGNVAVATTKKKKGPKPPSSADEFQRDW